MNELGSTAPQEPPSLPFRFRLIVRREEFGLNQSDLAELVGVSQGAVSKWERGASIPNLRQAIAQA